MFSWFDILTQNSVLIRFKFYFAPKPYFEISEKAQYLGLLQLILLEGPLPI